MTNRQYVGVQYSQGSREYDYHWAEDSPPEVGMQAQVTTPAGAVRTVTISTVHPSDYQPDSRFAVTKPAYKAAQQ